MRYSIGAACLFILSAPLAWAEDDTRALLQTLIAKVGALQNEVHRSNARVDELERELARLRAGQSPAQPVSAPPPAGSANHFAADAAAATATPAGKPAVTVGDAKGTYKIPGTDTSIGIGGFVKMDTLFSNVSAGRDELGDQLLIFSQIPVGRQVHGEHSQTTFHAKESRLWFKSSTPSAWGEVNTYVEIDFYGDAATYTYTPRLRHAYGSLGQFLAGQTWTTFLNSAVLPDHLDPNGAAGSIAPVRQPLLRWSQPFNLADTAMEWQAALESPRSRLRTDPLADTDVFNAPNADRSPDLVARLNANPGWGTLSLAALGRQIRSTDPLSGREQTAWGGAVSLAGKIDTVGTDNVRFTLNYGNALGRYAALNTFEDAAMNDAGEIQLVDTYGGMLSYQHFWSKTWRSSLTYGFVQADQPAYVGGLMTRQAQSVHANLLWSPLLQTVFGAEYTYGTRTVVDGREGDLHRIQFSARYNF